MKRSNDMKKTIKLGLLASTLALAAGPAAAEVYDLCAGFDRRFVSYDADTSSLMGMELNRDVVRNELSCSFYCFEYCRRGRCSRGILEAD